MANATIRKSSPKYVSLAALLFEIRLPLPLPGLRRQPRGRGTV